MTNAVGIIETFGLAHSLLVADEMLKMSDIRVLAREDVSEIYYTIIIEGEISAVQLAIDYGAEIANLGNALIAIKTIPRPVDDMKHIMPIKAKSD